MTRKRGRPKGHRLSEATKLKIAKSMTGNRHSQNTKDTIKASLLEYFKHRNGGKGHTMSGKTLIPGNYPQGPASLCYFNVAKWPINKLESNGQKVVELRFKEINYDHKQTKVWLHEEVCSKYQYLFRLPGQMGASFSRVSMPSKLNIGNIDVEMDRLNKYEMDLRDLLATSYGFNDAYSDDRLLLEYIIFEKNGVRCKWNVASKGNELVLVLTRVGNKPVNEITLAEAQGYAEGIADCLCEAKRVFQEPKEHTACPYSEVSIRLI